MLFRTALAALLLASTLDARASCDPAATDWIAKRIDTPTAFLTGTAEVWLYASGCVKVTFFNEHPLGGDVHWIEIPRNEVTAKASSWETRGAFALTRAKLGQERTYHAKTLGETHLSPPITDAAVTEIELRHPRTRQTSEAVRVYALEDQASLTKGDGWDTLKGVGRELAAYRALVQEREIGPARIATP